MPNGIVIIDKPQGWTSMDVCAKLRGILHEKRVGHAGTLDPMATGVLPVFVGQATKAVSFAEGGQKVYEAVLQLGLVTDTQDTTGETLEERAVTVTEDEVRAALPRFLGEIEQIPPMYSAIKVNGQKLYDLARQGREVARKPRKITIFDLALTQNLGNGQYALRVVCSKGTYIRTLCHDLGQALGCGGCMAALRRTEASGTCSARARLCSAPRTACSGSIRPTPSRALNRSASASAAIPCAQSSPTGCTASTGATGRSLPCRRRRTARSPRNEIFSACDADAKRKPKL